MKDIAVYGAGGYGREVACMIQQINVLSNQWHFVGFFDDNPVIHGTSNPYGVVLGGRETVNAWPTPLSIVIAIGTPSVINTIVTKITNPMIDFPNIVAPTVVFLDEKSVKMGKGNILGCNCFVSCNVKIGDFNIFNGYIPIGHDVCFGSYNVVMPSCNISGGVAIGDQNFLGVQSVILQNITIGDATRIGAGSVVMRNTRDGYLYLGSPAKIIEL